MARDKDLHPIHPGEILQEELLKTYQITPQKLAKIIEVREEIIVELVQEKRDITPQLSYLLGLYWGMRKNYWLDLQKHYDLEVRKDKERQGSEVYIKWKLIEKKNSPNLNQDQKKVINDVLIQGSITENVKWKSAYESWEKLNWSGVAKISH